MTLSGGRAELGPLGIPAPPHHNVAENVPSSVLRRRRSLRTSASQSSDPHPEGVHGRGGPKTCPQGAPVVRGRAPRLEVHMVREVVAALGLLPRGPRRFAVVP